MISGSVHNHITINAEVQLCDSLGEGLLDVCKPMVNALVDHMSANIGVMILL